MRGKEILEQFLKVSQVNEEDVVDYRFCTKFYAGVYIPNSIILQLKKDKYEENHLIYTAFDVSEMVEELSKIMGKNTEFERGFHSALEEIKNYGAFELAK